MNKYRVIALIGKAGSGKDTILKRIVSIEKNINEIISCTTRPPRQHEINGVNYNFLSDEEFINKIYDDEMIETSNFNGWLYGTAYDTLKLDKINIGVFNPEGIYSLLRKKEEIDLKVFYINASDKTRMLRQLNREENPNVLEISRRFQTDALDFSKLKFDYEIINNETEEDLIYAIEAVRSKIIN